MSDYRVKWEVDVFDVESSREAAKKALVLQRNVQSIALQFTVWLLDYTQGNGDAVVVDLYEDAEPSRMTTVEYLRTLPFEQAMWWFIENGDDLPDRADVFFALRDRYRTGIV